MNSTQVRESLVRYGEALSAGDTKAIAECWELPALVLSDDGAIPVASRDEVEAFFAQAVPAYHAQGLMSTRPEIEYSVSLSKSLTAVIVRWPALAADGKERASEHSYYILRHDQAGAARVQVALTLSEPGES